MNSVEESNNSCSDVSGSLTERLRRENTDQFLTLVRMHLSFVVDINTDDVDSSTDKPKQFRWGFSKKPKNTPNAAAPTGNTKYGENSIADDGISKVYELIDFLVKEENVKQEGIFRRTGSLSRQQELKQLLMSGSPLGLDAGRFSVHDCASVLKGFLAELPQPLLMDQYYQTYCTLAVQYPPNAETSKSRLLTALQLLLLLLSPLHRTLLQRLLSLLRVAASHEASNRMSPDTLATMFTPHLLCPRKLGPEALHSDAVALAPVVSFMIRQSERLFHAPAQLSTDVAAYYTMRERRRVMSPDVDLDESISDRTAANTVYTFVDRHRTSAENEANPTDTALAQLYAHIQALPDSQHKRRLIKQFNRQNGYGTPIQVQRTGKAAGSKSLGESIKRHIFHKGLLNKTPKKSGSIPSLAEESIMTPRSRKPLIITSEQRDTSLVETKKPEISESPGTIYGSMSPKNDSDFVSSDESERRSHYSQSSSERDLKISDYSVGRMENVGTSHSCIKVSITEGSPCSSESVPVLPNFKTSHEMSPFYLKECKSRSLTDPFREYLLSRSVLTAAPVDLSLMNKSEESAGGISDSLMFCLDGNVPSDLTSSISNLVVDKVIHEEKDHDLCRSPLRNLKNYININNFMEKSPTRKRSAVSERESHEEAAAGTYKKISLTPEVIKDKENLVTEQEKIDISLWETDL